MADSIDAKQWLRPEAVSRLSGLDLIARRVVEGFITGLHKSPYHGFSAEFSEYRPYYPGAPLKFMDWRLWGRTGRYYIKAFEEETNLRATLVVDGSASMGYGSGETTKQQYTVWLAAALTFLLLKQRDAVGLALFDETLRSLIRPRAVMGQLNTILHPLSQMESQGRTAAGRVLNQLAERLHRRSLVCILSDLMDDETAVIQAIKNFRIRGHEIIVFHILDPLELNLSLGSDSVLVDAETGQRLPVDTRQAAAAYSQRITTWTEGLKHACLDMRADYVRLQTDTPFDRALSAFLNKRMHIGA